MQVSLCETSVNICQPYYLHSSFVNYFKYTMQQDRSTKYSSFSLLNLLKLGIFETIYAKTCPPGSSSESERGIPTRKCCPDDAAGGDAPSPPPRPAQPRKCDCIPPDATKCSASDRGKTGAGVTGSRGSRVVTSSRRISPDHDEDLPEGASHPGLLRHIHNEARYRLPQCFEGACVSVKQASSNNWVLGHTLAFSSVSPGGYKMLLSYVDRKKPTALPYFVMEAAPGGQLSSELRVGPTAGTRATLVTQIADGEFYSFESIIDAYFQNCTASVIAVNRDFIAVHYLQAMTEDISLGAEVVARGHSAEVSSVSGAARWANEKHSLSGTLGNRGLDLCYARAVTPYLAAAAMIEVGFAIRRAVATLAYEWRTEQWTVRGSADSDGLVGATLQRSLGGNRAQLACAISALLNHPNNKFRLGFGITAAIV